MQAYYTTPSLSLQIAKFFTHAWSLQHNYKLHITDLCCGEGRLAEHVADRTSTTKITLVDIDAEAVAKARKKVDGRDKITEAYAMSVEEWARTAGKPSQIVLCNPPFGERVGRTHLGEFFVDVHEPKYTRFESYFLAVASSVATAYIAMILPDSCLAQDEVRQVMGEMADAGWDVSHCVALPIDGFENARVKTHLWVFVKTANVYDWVDACIERVQTNQCPVLYQKTIRSTHRTQYGNVQSYLLDTSAQVFISKRISHPKVKEATARQLVALWEMPPGALWERMGKTYTLGRHGWVLLNNHTHVDGLPASDAFSQAHCAHELLKQGAVHTAQDVLSRVDMKLLKAEYGEHSGASFLHALPQGRACKDAIQQDLVNLGCFKCPVPTGLERMGDYVLSREHMTLSHWAKLYLEMPQYKGFELFWRQLGHVIIPVDEITLRANWIPKTWLASYYRLKLDKKGDFYARNTSSFGSDILAWLNYNRHTRIKAGTSGEVMRMELELAAWVNTPTRRTNSRLELIAHYLVSQQDRVDVMASVPQQTGSALPMSTWQKQDRARGLSGQVILDWDVGLGKTAGSMAIAHAHTGKTLFCVPSSVMGKWQAEFKKFYPDEELTILGFRQTKSGKNVRIPTKDLAGTLAEAFASSKWLLTTHEVLACIDLHEHERQCIHEEDAWYLHGSVGQRDKLARERYIQHAAKRQFESTSELKWTDLPLGRLLVVVDEAHRFKSLNPMPTSGWGEQLIMAGNCTRSKRAQDMYLKMRLLRQRGGKSLALTATPVCNSFIELFNMLKIFSPDALNRRNLTTPQLFIDRYCVIKQHTSMSVGGSVRTGQTITGFKNTEDLQALSAEAMISRTAATEDMDLPEATEHVCRIEPTPGVELYLKARRDDLDELVLSNDDAPKSERHIFEILAEFDAVAAHPPLVGISTEHPKAEQLVRCVLEHHTQDPTAPQLVFISRKQAHEGYKQALVDAGFDAKRICVLNADTAKTHSKRLKVQKNFARGDYDVVIGGALMQEGIDLQINTQAVHFVDIGWHGQVMHQCKGRAVRQGNTREQVDVYYYVLDGSTDIYRWMTVQNKTHWFRQLQTTTKDTDLTNIFDNALDMEMIITLSNRPDEVREAMGVQIGNQRVKKQVSQAMSIARRMFLSADNNTFGHLESKVRCFDALSGEFVDELVRWVQIYRHLGLSDTSNRLYWLSRHLAKQKITPFAVIYDEHGQPALPEVPKAYESIETQRTFVHMAMTSNLPEAKSKVRLVTLQHVDVVEPRGDSTKKVAKAAVHKPVKKKKRACVQDGLQLELFAS